MTPSAPTQGKSLLLSSKWQLPINTAISTKCCKSWPHVERTQWRTQWRTHSGAHSGARTVARTQWRAHSGAHTVAHINFVVA